MPSALPNWEIGERFTAGADRRRELSEYPASGFAESDCGMGSRSRRGGRGGGEELGRPSPGNREKEPVFKEARTSP